MMNQMRAYILTYAQGIVLLIVNYKPITYVLPIALVIVDDITHYNWAIVFIGKV